MKKYNICFVGGADLIRSNIDPQIYKYNTQNIGSKAVESAVSVKNADFGESLDSVIQSFDEPFQIVLIPGEKMSAEGIVKEAKKYGNRVRKENSLLNGSKTNYTLYVVVPDSKMGKVKKELNLLCDQQGVRGYSQRSEVSLGQMILTYDIFGFKKEKRTAAPLAFEDNPHKTKTS